MTQITTKFQSFVISLTTLIVFTLWFNYEEKIQINPYLKIISTTLISLGLYRFVASILLLLFRKIRLVRKFFLGPKYLEGTWVGFYIGLKGQVRYIVERFEQDFETLIIRGTSYNEVNGFHGSWISFPANVDISKGELTYMYDLKGINEVSNGTGIAFFSFHRKDQNTAPRIIKGFSADLHNDGKRTKSFEYKLSDGNIFTDAEAIQKAIDFYNKNKTNF